MARSLTGRHWQRNLKERLKRTEEFDSHRGFAGSSMYSMRQVVIIAIGLQGGFLSGIVALG